MVYTKIHKYLSMGAFSTPDPRVHKGEFRGDDGRKYITPDPRVHKGSGIEGPVLTPSSILLSTLRRFSSSPEVNTIESGLTRALKKIECSNRVMSQMFQECLNVLLGIIDKYADLNEKATQIANNPYRENWFQEVDVSMFSLEMSMDQGHSSSPPVRIISLYDSTDPLKFPSSQVSPESSNLSTHKEGSDNTSGHTFSVEQESATGTVVFFLKMVEVMVKQHIKEQVLAYKDTYIQNKMEKIDQVYRQLEAALYWVEDATKMPDFVLVQREIQEAKDHLLSDLEEIKANIDYLKDKKKEWQAACADGRVSDITSDQLSIADTCIRTLESHQKATVEKLSRLVSIKAEIDTLIHRYRSEKLCPGNSKRGKDLLTQLEWIEKAISRANIIAPAESDDLRQEGALEADSGVCAADGAAGADTHGVRQEGPAFMDYLTQIIFNVIPERFEIKSSLSKSEHSEPENAQQIKAEVQEVLDKAYTDLLHDALACFVHHQLAPIMPTVSKSPRSVSAAGSGMGARAKSSELLSYHQAQINQLPDEYSLLRKLKELSDSIEAKAPHLDEISGDPSDRIKDCILAEFESVLGITIKPPIKETLKTPQHTHSRNDKAKAARIHVVASSDSIPQPITMDILNRLLKEWPLTQTRCVYDRVTERLTSSNSPEWTRFRYHAIHRGIWSVEEAVLWIGTLALDDVKGLTPLCEQRYEYLKKNILTKATRELELVDMLEDRSIKDRMLGKRQCVLQEIQEEMDHLTDILVACYLRLAEESADKNLSNINHLIMKSPAGGVSVDRLTRAQWGQISKLADSVFSGDRVKIIQLSTLVCKTDASASRRGSASSLGSTIGSVSHSESHSEWSSSQTLKKQIDNWVRAYGYVPMRVCPVKEEASLKPVGRGYSGSEVIIMPIDIQKDDEVKLKKPKSADIIQTLSRITQERSWWIQSASTSSAVLSTKENGRLDMQANQKAPKPLMPTALAVGIAIAVFDQMQWVIERFESECGKLLSMRPVDNGVAVVAKTYVGELKKAVLNNLRPKPTAPSSFPTSTVAASSSSTSLSPTMTLHQEEALVRLIESQIQEADKEVFKKLRLFLEDSSGERVPNMHEIESAYSLSALLLSNARARMGDSVSSLEAILNTRTASLAMLKPGSESVPVESTRPAMKVGQYVKPILESVYKRYFSEAKQRLATVEPDDVCKGRYNKDAMMAFLMDEPLKKEAELSTPFTIGHYLVFNEFFKREKVSKQEKVFKQGDPINQLNQELRSLMQTVSDHASTAMYEDFTDKGEASL